MAAISLSACGPAFNWRETAVGTSSLLALFPCKPLAASHTVALGGKDVELRMTSCETSGVTVAVGHASLAGGAAAGPVLAQWRAATLASMRASSSTVTPLHLLQATPLAESVALSASGTRTDGRPVALRAAWFSRGPEVFAALMYAESVNADVAETFFSGLRFR